MYSDGVCEDIGAGQIHFIKKGCAHKIEVYHDEDFRYICIGYNRNNNEENMRDFGELVKYKNAFILNDDSTVKKLTSLFVDEIYLWDNYSKDMLDKYFVQIIVSLQRIKTGRAKKPQNNEIALASNTVYKMLRYIDREYINIESVRVVSEKLSYNEYYLSHVFKEKVGITIKEYITQKKISHACELLKTSQLGIEEISEYLNFASSHLSL